MTAATEVCPIHGLASLLLQIRQPSAAVSGSVCDASWSCRAVYDYQFTNSEGCVFNKLVFLNWCAVQSGGHASALASLCRSRSISQGQLPTSCHEAHAQSLRKYVLINSAAILASSLSVCLVLHLLGGPTTRAPDTARTKAKMMYASTKDFFKGFLDGISVELQASELEDITEKDIADAVRSSVTRQ